MGAERRCFLTGADLKKSNLREARHYPNVKEALWAVRIVSA